jgi:hypothetical protein
MLPGMAPCADRAAPAPLHRVVDHQIDTCSDRDNGFEEEHEHLTAPLSRRPTRSSEGLEKEAPVGRVLVATGTQSCRDRLASLSQERSGSHDHPFPPPGSGTPWPKDGQSFSHGIGRGRNILLSERWLWSASLFPQEDAHAWFFSHNGQSQAKRFMSIGIACSSFSSPTSSVLTRACTTGEPDDTMREASLSTRWETPCASRR